MSLDPDDRQLNTKAKVIRRAVAERAEALGQIEAGTYTSRSDVRVREYAEVEWLPALESSDLRANTVSFYRYRLRKNIIPHIGGYRLAEVTPTVLDNLYRELADEGVSQSTLRAARVTVRRLFDHARRKRVISRNPDLDADVPKVEGPRRTGWWTPDELAAFLRVTSDHRLAALWALLVTAGLRRGEALALRWEDLAGSRLTIRRNRVRVEGENFENGPKTAAGVRSIGLDAQTVELLRRHRKAQLAEKMAHRDIYDDRGYIFADEAGRPLDPQTFSRTFARLIRKVGLRPIRLHDVRHSAASAWIAKGMNVKAVSQRLGHSKVQTTLDLYVHVTEADDQQLAEQMAPVLWGVAK